MKPLRRLTGAAALLVAVASGAAAPALQQRDTQVITLPAPPPSARPAESTAAKAAPGIPRNGLMWKATAPGGATAYLVGSIHYGTEQLYPLPSQIEAAFWNSSTLVVELDARKLQDPMSLLPLVSSTGMYPPDDSLWNHVAPATHELISSFCTSHSLSEDIVARFKPWMATFTLLAIEMQSLGFRPELGLDMHFLNSSEGKTVQQIESAEEQLRLLSRMPEPAMEKSLQDMLRNPDQNRDFIEKVQSAWLRGDSDAIEKLITKDTSLPPTEKNAMFGARNVRMTEAVDRCLKGSQQCFIVVGAGHLVGRDGIVRLLEKRGMAVKQVLSTQ